MVYGWIENSKVRDVCKDPSNMLHPEVAKFYATELDDSVGIGYELVEGEWVNPFVSESVELARPEKVYPKVTPVEFKMLFTSQERMAIKAARVTNEIIDDGYSILEDTRLTTVDLGLKSIHDLICYLVSLDLLTTERVEEILSGKVL